jgi:hypothetical protein
LVRRERSAGQLARSVLRGEASREVRFLPGGFAGKKQVGMRPKETTMWYRAVGCIVTLTLSLLAAPLAADAQPSAKVARIGYLAMTGGAGSPRVEAFRQGLRDLGYVEGKTMALAYRSAEGKPERLPALAAELVRLPK